MRQLETGWCLKLKKFRFATRRVSSSIQILNFQVFDDSLNAPAGIQTWAVVGFYLALPLAHWRLVSHIRVNELLAGASLLHFSTQSFGVWDERSC